MIGQTDIIPVLAAPLLDPGSARITMELPSGLTIAEIVNLALPRATVQDLAHARVALVTERGSVIVAPEHWARVRPRPGVHVVIRIVPGKDALRSILSVVVSIAAIAIGQVWLGPALAGTFGLSAGAWAGITALGVTVLGNLLINALIPPTKAKNDKSTSYQITGWQNKLDPNGVVPMIMGEVRYAPPFAATSYTEVVGDLQYIRAIFCFGYGDVALSDFQIGDTPGSRSSTARGNRWIGHSRSTRRRSLRRASARNWPGRNIGTIRATRSTGRG
jgi:hypothetical protein